MKIEDLRCFLSVAETGSITKAAQKHYMTQQGMSRIISGLERELCSQLLVRNNNRIFFTDAGKLTLQYAEEIQKNYWELVSKLSEGQQDEMDAEESGITIYTTPILCTMLLPTVLTTLSKKFPNVRFSVIEMEILDVADHVNWTRNCIGIVSFPSFLTEKSTRMNAGELVYEKMFRDRLALAVPANHPLVGRESISIEEMTPLPFALYYTEVNTLKEFFGDQYQPNVLIHTTNQRLCHEMVEKGKAVCIWSDLVDYYNQNAAIVRVPIEKTYEISYGCLWDKQVEPSPVAKEAAEEVQREFQRVTRYLVQHGIR